MTGKAIYRITEQDLARLLKLPAGQRVIGVSADFQSLSALVMIAGPGLPEHTPGTYLEPTGTLGDLYPDVMP